jgi:predicted DNA-binding transcriptional regulator AlpA
MVKIEFPQSRSTGVLIREPEVLRIVPISRATLWSRVRAGTFPAPVKISDRVSAWRVEDVARWVESLRPAGAGESTA